MEALVETTFTAHQTKLIGPWARQNSDNFADVYRFVLATIQQPLSITAEVVRDFKANGSDSRFAFGFKAPALDWLEEKSGWMYDTAMYIDHIESNHGSDYSALLGYFASLPGMGLVKGGFMAQLCFGVIGCLDRHNIERFGLNPSRFTASRIKKAKRLETRRQILDEYLDLCVCCGGSAVLWAEWCEYVAGRDTSFNTPQEVSYEHVKAIGVE